MESNDPLDDETKEALNSLCSVIIEMMLEKNSTPLEIFERYTDGLRSKIHLHHHDFPQRFIEGYKVLLETLQKS